MVVSMTERQILRDPVGVRGINLFGSAETATALGALTGEQMALAGPHPHHFTGAGDLESFGHGLLRFNTFGTSHNSYLSFKKSAHYRLRPESNQAVF